MKQMKGLAYLRVSGKAQVKGDGFARQRAKISKFASKSGIVIDQEFVDAGVSGTVPLSERPGLSGLLVESLASGAQVVVVEKADRLGRDLVETELIIRRLQDEGLAVYEAEGGTNLTDGDGGNPTAKLLRQLLGAIAEFEKDALVGKMKVARERVRARDGRCEGVKPYGDLPGEAVGLARLLELRRKPRGRPRRSMAEIASKLNEEGVPTRKGGTWSRSTVQTILARLRRR